MLKKILLATTLLQIPVFANCISLKTCIEEASIISSKNYIVKDDVLKNDHKYLTEIKLDKENSELIISTLLHEEGMSRINLDKSNILVISSRDIRYHAMDKIKWTGNTQDIPKVNDYFLVTFPIKHHEGADSITRGLRPFISRYGRIINSANAPIIIVQDTGTNLRRIASLIEELDVPLTKEARAQIKKSEIKNKNKKEANSRKEKSQS